MNVQIVFWGLETFVKSAYNVSKTTKLLIFKLLIGECDASSFVIQRPENSKKKHENRRSFA